MLSLLCTFKLSISLQRAVCLRLQSNISTRIGVVVDSSEIGRRTAMRIAARTVCQLHSYLLQIETQPGPLGPTRQR